MAETVTLQIPKALYQRLAIVAGATQRSLDVKKLNLIRGEKC